MADDVANHVVTVVDKHVLAKVVDIHWYVLVRSGIYLKQDVQDRYQRHEREHVKPLRHKVENNGPREEFAVRLHVTPQQREELFDHKVLE